MSIDEVRAYRCVLGPVSVTVRTNHDAVTAHLRDFYRVDPVLDDQPHWIVEALVGDAVPGMETNGWGVAHDVVAGERLVRLRATDPQRLAVSARKTVREALIDYCEQRHYVMLHASAVADRDRVVVIVGDKGSGKTTLALKAAMFHGMRYVSNDHLIVYAEHDRDEHESALVLTSLPTPIPVKIGTFVDVEDMLPSPWDTAGVDIDAFRRRPRARLYGRQERVFYTFPRLGQPNPVKVTIPKSGATVLVALASYTSGETCELGVDDSFSALMGHVRTDWMFDRRLNQRFLPRYERDRDTYIADARNLVHALVNRASVIEWRHEGNPDDLVDRASAIGEMS